MEWKMEWNGLTGRSGDTKDEMSGAPSGQMGSTKQDGSKLTCDTNRETWLLVATDSVEALAMAGRALSRAALHCQTSRAGRSHRRWMPMASASNTPCADKHGAETKAFSMLRTCRCHPSELVSARRTGDVDFCFQLACMSDTRNVWWRGQQ